MAPTPDHEPTHEKQVHHGLLNTRASSGPSQEWAITLFTTRYYAVEAINVRLYLGLLSPTAAPFYPTLRPLKPAPGPSKRGL